jgi:hypothetical protein
MRGERAVYLLGVVCHVIWAANCRLFAAVEEETMNTRAKHTVFIITVAAALCCANAAQRSE